MDESETCFRPAAERQVSPGVRHQDILRPSSLTTRLLFWISPPLNLPQEGFRRRTARGCGKQDRVSRVSNWLV